MQNRPISYQKPLSMFMIGALFSLQKVSSDTKTQIEKRLIIKPKHSMLNTQSKTL